MYYYMWRVGPTNNTVPVTFAEINRVESMELCLSLEYYNI
jgi:hypothetical protein